MTDKASANNPLEDDYKWPDNLYTEAQDMASLSFLIYVLGYATDVSRDEDMSTKEGEKLDPAEVLNRRNYDAKEILDMVEENIDVLQKKYPDSFTEGIELENLRALVERSDQSELERPLTLQYFDDVFQKQELVFAITKDDTNKRIVVIFRGTENALAAKTNWLTNVSLLKKAVETPELVKEALPKGKIHFHTGFYNYIFSTTADDSDEATERKYDVIIKEVKTLLKENPGYKLYVTGHSLGAAVSTVFAFYATCEDDIPKPVTCINFASPRNGDSNFRKVIEWLEEKRMLRLLRFVNENDTVTAIAPGDHVGIAIRLYNSDKEPYLEYAGGDESWRHYLARLWNNTVLASANFGYDHFSYRERIKKHKDTIEKMDLNKLYDQYYPVQRALEEDTTPSNSCLG